MNNEWMDGLVGWWVGGNALWSGLWLWWLCYTHWGARKDVWVEYGIQDRIRGVGFMGFIPSIACSVSIFPRAHTCSLP